MVIRMPKKSTRSCDERYNSYKEILKFGGKKIQVENPETGVYETKYRWYGKKALAKMKAFCEAYDMIDEHRGMKGQSLEQTIEFCRDAINENGWETSWGNLRKVSPKMRALVNIYDEKMNGKTIDESEYSFFENDSDTISSSRGLMPLRGRRHL